MSTPLRALALALALVLVACAGRERPGTLANGEEPTDAGSTGFLGVDAIPVRTPDCGGSEAVLTRRRATAMLVIDRSGSMNDPTTGTNPVRKWDALLAALREVLPQVEQAVEIGLVTFPAMVPAAATPEQVCRVDPTPLIDPRYGAATTILETLQRLPPSGGTPTANALQAAATWFLRAPDREGERYLILATDGAPNCALGSDPASCRCSGPRERLCNPAVNSNAVTNCLDAERPVAILRDLGSMGVGTYVLGLTGTEDFADVLDAMAVAGGRARPTAPRYYPVASARDLASEFRAITSSIAECRFTLRSAPPDPALVDVRLDGASIYRDVRHNDGWDWSPENPLELRFYGRSCQVLQAASGGSRLRAVFGCAAPTPP